MKSPLDRTAVLSRDYQELLDEYPNCKYLVLLPENQVAMVADRVVEVSKNVMNIYIGDELVGSFNAAMPWYMVDKRHVEMMTKKEQLTRHIQNMKEESTFMEENMPDELKKFTEAVSKVAAGGSDRYGQYL